MQKVYKKLSIPQILVIGFLSVLTVGGSLLMLPVASQTQTFTGFWDAFFTAASALFVTGQITLTTATHWNLFGKTVILSLIEIGGLGFMSFIVIFFFLLGKKLSLREKKVIQESLNIDEISQAKSLVKYVILFSLAIQAMGAFLLSIRFIPMLGFAKGAYYSIFHSISAFCNAGFDLFGNSLISFQEDPYVLAIIMSLIVIGGLGFIVWRDLLTYHKNKKLLLHTRLVLSATLIIIGVSFILFTISELKNGTFAHLKPFDQFMNTLFLVVTPRTAGYASIDYRSLSLAGLFITLLLMFIGGSSGSTAGGFKTTTLSILVLSLVANLKREEPHFQKRSIGKGRVDRAVLLLVVGIVLISIATILLLLTQTLPDGFGLEAVLVEVFSCFGTVGLSLGLTPYLNWFGKFVLIILMFMGRVGTLTVILSLNTVDKENKVHYPEGSVLIG
ncbi:MAG: Trk family potassium uptake protein [Erysipelothrix sp.]|nr:Trk family potassium uptake protein [Erysipelothrix sp.]